MPKFGKNVTLIRLYSRVFAELLAQKRSRVFRWRGFVLRHFFIRGDGVLRKVWLVVLTVLTVAFLVALAVLSEPRPTQWLTDQEVEELVEQDMVEKGFIDPTTGKFIYD